ncbi:Phage tail assembly [Lactococcus lactis subsp. lactis]|uniref:hypothetical protein n=1 Tax=Lactococcus lactis TaxID=1358 RepID=UPI00071D1637|nr:hypothetical protein [Lactococcus lactis]KST87635.1 Phage tail assembly [Lactococcus lactis subsp. lactis]
MSYEKQTWNKYDDLKTEEENIENGAVVTDNRMNHIEDGIGDNNTNLASHLVNTNNPHKVTAAQVGLDKVDNVKQASKAEFDSHTSDASNPHKVTASQVGSYSKSESDDKLATQKQAMDSHVNNKANPHAVTASQVGAYSKQEIDAKLSKAVMADDSGKVSIGTLDSNTLAVQGTKIYPNTKDGVWTVERLFDKEYRLTTVMSTGADVTSTWNSLFISSEIPHPNLPSGYTKTSWGVTLSNSNNLMWCSISGASVFRLIAGASTSAATRTVIVTVYASK